MPIGRNNQDLEAYRLLFPFLPLKIQKFSLGSLNISISYRFLCSKRYLVTLYLEYDLNDINSENSEKKKWSI